VSHEFFNISPVSKWGNEETKPKWRYKIGWQFYLIQIFWLVNYNMWSWICYIFFILNLFWIWFSLQIVECGVQLEIDGRRIELPLQSVCYCYSIYHDCWPIFILLISPKLDSLCPMSDKLKLDARSQSTCWMSNIRLKIHVGCFIKKDWVYH